MKDVNFYTIKKIVINIMIERYSRKELKIFGKIIIDIQYGLTYELAAAEAMEKYKIIPKGVVKKVKSRAKINPKRILEIEDKVKHDVIAFLTSITEKVEKKQDIYIKA